MHRPPAPVRRALLAVCAALAAVVLGVGAGVDRASACSCIATDDTAAFERADVVFQGTLVDIVTPEAENWSSTDAERFVFTVDKVFKGEAALHQSVFSARDGASCGLEIDAGGEYLLFGRYGDATIGVADDLTSNLCSGTRPLGASAGVPATFGAGVLPRAGTSHVDPPDDDSLPVGWIALLAAVVIVGVGTVFVVRRR